MIINTDNLVWLRKQPDESVHHIITDPPYLIDFMGKGWDKPDNIAGHKEFWEECLRVLKPGGHLLVFGHSRTHHRVMCAIEDAGAEIRDCLMWLQGQGFPKSQDLGKKAGEEWKGWGNALKPAYEPIIMARKKFRGSLTNNVLENGTGALNIDATRVGSEIMPAIETKTETTEIGWEKKSYTTPEKTGRHPANIMLSHNEGCKLVGETEEIIENGRANRKVANSSSFHNGLEPTIKKEITQTTELYECEEGCPVKELDEQSGITKAGKRREGVARPRQGFMLQPTDGKANSPDNYGDGGGASRFFYCPKVSKRERNLGCEDLESQKVNDGRKTEIDNPYQRGETLRKNTHPTVKPIKLMEWLVKLISKEGQTILDPFAGSGSTGIACVLLGREFIGLELNPNYCEIAEKRIDWWKTNEK